MADGSWPEHGQELARKAFEILVVTGARIERDEIDYRVAFNIADAIYDTCAGLISWDDASVIDQIRKEYKRLMEEYATSSISD